jgi:hypothetical protein
MRNDDTLPPCTRYGATIEESDSDVLVYSSSERDFENTGDLGPRRGLLRNMHARDRGSVQAQRRAGRDYETRTRFVAETPQNR